MAPVEYATSTREERWLYCRLDKGMFSDEIAVTYPATATKDWARSVFVPKAAVQGQPGSRGKVRVAILHRGGKLLAVLPSSRRDIVQVAEADTTD